MCGIAGLLAPGGDPSDQAAHAARMALAVAHRGPDDAGEWTDRCGQAAMGFQRLAIIDLTPGGHQPMTSADGRYVVALNGEIYNYASLRKELPATEFRGTSDTEVLLAAVSHWGLEAALPRLWGMFAFALWDARSRALHLVRDRLGKKPMYYGWQGDTFLFGSELKALRAHPAFHAELDRDAVASYMRYSYVPAPASIYRGIHKLMPASWLTVRPDRPGELPLAQVYWDLVRVARAGLDDPLAMSDEDAIDAVEQLAADAVRLRSFADVPVGAFLSGGIDSTVVTALMQAQSALPVQTFTIAFDAAGYDESHHARAVAAHLGTDHTELRVTPEDARAVIPRLASIYDEPFADASQIPTVLIAQLARRQVTVALTGDGGDEVFGGYNRYVAGTRLWNWMSVVPRGARSTLARALTAVPVRALDAFGAGADRLLPARRQGIIGANNAYKLATVLGLDGIDQIYERLVSTWPDPKALVKGGRESSTNLIAEATGVRDPAHRMMLADMLGYLPDDILVKVDRASMSASLEARAPLLDHRLVELSWRLPLHQKIRDGKGKWVLRRVMERYISNELTARPKHGFSVPIDQWLRGSLRDWAQDLLSEDRLTREGLLEPTPVREALRAHLDGRRNLQHQLWAVLMLESWLAQQRAGGLW